MHDGVAQASLGDYELLSTKACDTGVVLFHWAIALSGWFCLCDVGTG